MSYVGCPGASCARTYEDVVSVVRWAAERGRKIAPRGQGHSVYGRAQVAEGIVIEMTPFRTVHDVCSGQAIVGAGATWSDVVAATLPLGRVPPTLTDYLGLSVGGTLAVGGIGSMTSRHGMQSDNVLELDVVTGTGEMVTCSPDSHADLFHAVRAGLGQVAVIVRATLKLVPAPQQVRRYLLFYPDLKTMLADQRVLATDERFDAVQGAVLPTPVGWTFRLDAVKQFSDRPPDDTDLLSGLSDDRSRAKPGTLTYIDYLHRLAALEQALRANGQWFHPHPWLTTFVGDAQVEAVVSAELAALTPADLGPFGQVVLSAFRRQAVTSPLVRLPADDLCYAFNLIRIPASVETAEADRLVRANRSVYERIRAPEARCTLSAPFQCPAMTGGGTSGRSGDCLSMPSRSSTRGTSSPPDTSCSSVCCTGGGWSGKNATTARCVPNLHASKSHHYPQHTGSSDSHPRPHRTLGHVRARQDIDGVLADHAEDMVM